MHFSDAVASEVPFEMVELSLHTHAPQSDQGPTVHDPPGGSSFPSVYANKREREREREREMFGLH